VARGESCSAQLEGGLPPGSRRSASRKITSNPRKVDHVEGGRLPVEEKKISRKKGAGGPCKRIRKGRRREKGVSPEEFNDGNGVLF